MLSRYATRVEYDETHARPQAMWVRSERMQYRRSAYNAATNEEYPGVDNLALGLKVESRNTQKG